MSLEEKRFMGMVAKRFREPGGGQASARELHGHSSTAIAAGWGRGRRPSTKARTQGY